MEKEIRDFIYDVSFGIRSALSACGEWNYHLVFNDFTCGFVLVGISAHHWTPVTGWCQAALKYSGLFSFSISWQAGLCFAVVRAVVCGFLALYQSAQSKDFTQLKKRDRNQGIIQV